MVFLSLTFFLCVQALAQNMKVVDFRELTNDLTANLHGTQETDENGEVAALIKIVTPETGFTFDGGSLGIVKVVQQPGEVWLYVPRRAQKLTIGHAAFGVLRNYTYPVPIEGAKTYEMLLDIGTGVYATITAPVAKSEIYIDNEYAGVAPLYNRYLNYGKHTVQAINGKFEGTAEVYVTSDRKRLNIDVDMADMSQYYGDVHVTVDNNADIYYGGKRVASGVWDTQLKEGNYVIETRKADHDNATTSFTVVAQQQNNITAIAPSPYTGYLRVYTRPQNVMISDSRGKFIDLSEQTPVAVGSHQYQFLKKGYVTQSREYKIVRNQAVRDTVELQPIQYFKDFTFYFGAGFSISGLMGATAMAGVTYKHHDLQLSYTLGLNQSKAVNIYDTSWNFLSTQKYKKNAMAVKYGYQIPLMNKLAVTPQLGFAQQSVSAQVVTGSEKFGQGASCKCLTVGAKLLAVPFNHVYVFLAPEFAIAMSKDASFDLIAKDSNVGLGGFSAVIGVMAYF